MRLESYARPALGALGGAVTPPAIRSYLDAFHVPLHREFVHGFIANLQPQSDPFADLNLVAKIEVALAPDGSLDAIGVAQSSGNRQYDFQALSAVYRAAPYLRPPGTMRSADGRSYLRWAYAAA